MLDTPGGVLETGEESVGHARGVSDTESVSVGHWEKVCWRHVVNRSNRERQNSLRLLVDVTDAASISTISGTKLSLSNSLEVS